MTLSTEVQAAIYGQAEGLPKLGVSPVQVSRHGGDLLYEFRFGKFHIYHDTSSMSGTAPGSCWTTAGDRRAWRRCSRKRGASSTRCRNRPPDVDHQGAGPAGVGGPARPGRQVAPVPLGRARRVRVPEATRCSSVKFQGLDALTALTPPTTRAGTGAGRCQGFGRRTAAQLVGIHIRQIPLAAFVIAKRRGRFYREAQRDASRDRPHPHPDQWPPGETQPKRSDLHPMKFRYAFRGEDLTGVSHAVYDDGRVEVAADHPPVMRSDGLVPQGSAPSARGINKGGRTTGNTRVAKMADRARSEGVKPRAQAGGAPGDPPRRRRSDAGKPRPKSRTRPELEATPAAVSAAVSCRPRATGRSASAWAYPKGLPTRLKGEHDRAANVHALPARTA